MTTPPAAMTAHQRARDVIIQLGYNLNMDRYEHAMDHVAAAIAAAQDDALERAAVALEELSWYEPAEEVRALKAAP